MSTGISQDSGETTSPRASSAQRLEYLDLARGLAMVCIVLGHLQSPEINRVVYAFHIPLFYLVTGYFTSDRRTLRNTATRRARTLLVPYFVTCVCIITGKALVNEFVGDGRDSLGLIRTWTLAALYGAGDTWQEPFFIQGIGALWFLLATFWASITLRWLLDRTALQRMVCVLVLAIASYQSSRRLFWLPWSVQAAGLGLFYMYLGWVWHRLEDRLGARAIPIGVDIASLVFAITMWLNFIRNFKGFWLVHCHIGRGCIDIVCSICACYVVLRCCKRVDALSHGNPIQALCQPLRAFGRYSLIALCVHDFELTVMPWARSMLLEPFAEVSAGIHTALLCLLMMSFVVVGTLILAKARATRRLFGYDQT